MKDLLTDYLNRGFGPFKEIRGKFAAFILNDQGQILENDSKWGYPYHSVVDALISQGISFYFPIPQELKNAFGPQSNAARTGISQERPFAIFLNHRPIFRFESPDPFYSLLPTESLAIVPIDNELYLAVLTFISTLPDIHLHRTDGILYLDRNDCLAGFNRSFSDFFKERFPGPESLLGVNARELLLPSPLELEKQALAQLPSLPMSDYPSIMEIRAPFTELSAPWKIHPPDGLFLNLGNPAEDLLFLPFPMEPGPRDFRIDLDIEAQGDLLPLFSLGDQEKANQAYPDYNGYLMGPHGARPSHWILKRCGFARKSAPAVFEKGPCRVSFERQGGALRYVVNDSTLFEFFDAYPLAIVQPVVFLVFRQNMGLRLKGMRIASRPAVEHRNPEPLLRLNTPRDHFFILNPLDLIGLVSSHSDIRAYMLENVSDIHRRVEALRKENRRLSLDIDSAETELPGISPEIEAVRVQALRTASFEATVLIEGETGTGKEVLARFIHHHSGRADYPFVKVDCAAIPAALIESELFGHEKGAYTGAVGQRIGLFEESENGTLFLDEVENLPASAQAKLLRFLEDKTLLRVGGTTPIRVNTRIIAASNQPLAACVKQGLFREDLFYRLEGLCLRLPPLRARRGDAAYLAARFMDHFCHEHGRPPLALSTEAFEALESHPWHGNIRELKNVIQRAVIFADSDILKPEHLQAVPGVAAARSALTPTGRKRYQRLKLNSDTIREAFQQNRGNAKLAAQSLGMSIRALYYRIDTLKLNLDELREG